MPAFLILLFLEVALEPHQRERACEVAIIAPTEMSSVGRAGKVVLRVTGTPPGQSVWVFVNEESLGRNVLIENGRRMQLFGDDRDPTFNVDYKSAAGNDSIRSFRIFALVLDSDAFRSARRGQRTLLPASSCREGTVVVHLTMPVVQ